MSLKECCIRGVKHEGETKGRYLTIADVKVYESLPEDSNTSYDKSKALLVLPDIYGVELNNAKLLADSFAQEGYATYIIDILHGDAVPEELMASGTFDLPAWFAKHPHDRIRASVDAVIADLRKNGIKRFAASGYCYGARFVVDLVTAPSGPKIDVGAVAHPSLLKAPGDFEGVRGSGVPFMWNLAESDQLFPAQAVESLKEVMKGDQNNRIQVWPGCEHGFAARGDISKPEVKAGKDGAFMLTVELLRDSL